MLRGSLTGYLIAGSAAAAAAAALGGEGPPIGPRTAGQDTLRPPIERTLKLDSARALLPPDAAGRVDWAAAIARGILKPRRQLPGAVPGPDLTGFDQVVTYRDSSPMLRVTFGHATHVPWLTCESCHLALFPDSTTRPTMEAINRGESCGRCHGTVAFPATSCWRCHPALPGPGDPPARPSDPLGEIVFPIARVTPVREEFPAARFPHWVHRIRFTCGACHDGLFPMRVGADTLTMERMERRQACGRCHDGRAAFGVVECRRCHPPAGGPTPEVGGLTPVGPRRNS